MKMLLNLNPHGIIILIKFRIHYVCIHFNIVLTFSDHFKLALFGTYILAEALQNFFSDHVASNVAIQTEVSLENSTIL